MNVARSGDKNHKGFSLIELLVVIAIISMLAALIFPVISNTKKRASLAQSKSNFRQIGAAINLYSLSQNDRLPGPLYRGQRTGYRNDFRVLGYYLWQYVGLAEPTNSWESFPLLDVPAVRKWPHDAFEFKAVYATNKGLVVGNEVIEPFGDYSGGTINPQPMKNSQLGVIGSLSAVWAIWELGGAGDPESRFRSRYPETIHGDKRTVLFFDGHAETANTDILPTAFTVTR